MKYICGYKIYVKCGRVRFNALTRLRNNSPHLETKLLTNNANQREEEGN